MPFLQKDVGMSGFSGKVNLRSLSKSFSPTKGQARPEVVAMTPTRVNVKRKEASNAKRPVARRFLFVIRRVPMNLLSTPEMNN